MSALISNFLFPGGTLQPVTCFLSGELTPRLLEFDCRPRVICFCGPKSQPSTSLDRVVLAEVEFNHLIPALFVVIGNLEASTPL